MRRPHRPLSWEPAAFTNVEGSMDPALKLQIAHDTATALLARVRGSGDVEILRRVLEYSNEHGIGEIAELWADAPAHSLPGALWRLYVIHASIGANPDLSAHAYQRGVESLDTIDAVVAGARQPTGPEDIIELADEILGGAFIGDLADALHRAAAFCRIEAHGITTLVAESEIGSSVTLERAVTLADFALDLHACAVLASKSALD